jgi:hypothetical protein
MGLLEKFCQYVSENEIIAKMKCSNAKIWGNKNNLEKSLNFYSLLWFKWIAKNMEEIFKVFF